MGVEEEQQRPLAAGRRADRQVRPSLAGLLAGAGVATVEQVREALAEGVHTGERLGEVLLRRRWATDLQLARVLAHQWKLRFADQDALTVGPFPGTAEILQLGGVPVEHERRRRIAICDPTEERFHAIRQALGDETEFVVVPKSRFDALSRTASVGSPETRDLEAEIASLQSELARNRATIARLRWQCRNAVAALTEARRQLVRSHELQNAAEARRRRDEHEIRLLADDLASHGKLIDAIRASLDDLDEQVGIAGGTNGVLVGHELVSPSPFE